MKKIVKKIFSVFLVFVLKIFYLFFKQFKIKENKIVFLSRQSDEISLDFLLLKEYLEINYNYHIVVLSKRFEDSDIGLFGNISYFIFLLKNEFHIATSKVAVLDSYSIPISVLKHKKQLKIIQIWHSLGANKKFGYQLLNKDNPRIKDNFEVFKMHKNYDAIISTSRKNTEFFSSAFGYKQNKFLEYGLPRIDYLLNNSKSISKKIFSSYPKLENKKNILYAPTFRDYEVNQISKIIKCINFNKYNLIIKLHPKQMGEISIYKDNVFYCKDFSALDLITVSDYIITDYSGIIQEALVLNKKIYLYLFDYSKYKKENGLNIDFIKEFPLISYKKIEDIYKKIENGDYSKKEYKKLKEKYLGEFYGNSTQLIANKIHEWMVI